MSTPTTNPAELAVHLGYVLKQLESMGGTLEVVRSSMATKADLVAFGQQQDAARAALEREVATLKKDVAELQHDRTAMRSSFRTAVAIATSLGLAGGGGGMYALVKRAPEPAKVAAAASP